MELLEMIRSNYGINPLNIEQITNNVYQIDDGLNHYAFKKSSLKEEQLSMWKHVYKQTYEKKLTSVLPIYLTISSNLYVPYNKQIYYLSPWINHKQINIDQIYQSLGQLHAQTKSKQLIKVDEVKEKFLHFKHTCQNYQRKLLSYVETFEQNRYMSPFELQVCTHYRDLEFALNKIKERIDQLINNEREEINWNIHLCHGSVDFSHILQKEQTFMINWEKATYQNATTDLIHLFKSEIKYYDSPTNDFIKLFMNYMKVNELTYDELIVLFIHLLDPVEYLQKLDQYMNESNNDAILIQSKTLQSFYRQLVFALDFEKQIEIDYQTSLYNDEDDEDD